MEQYNYFKQLNKLHFSDSEVEARQLTVPNGVREDVEIR